MKEITLRELEQYLSSLLNADQFDEKAYNGIQVNTRVSITKIATAVSASTETIEIANEIGAQALVVHHGIYCKGDAHPLVGRLYDKVYYLMQNNIGLLGYHLPLDAHREVGNNWKAAHDLGLSNCRPFFELDGNYIGVVGEREPIAFEAFQKEVEQYYGRPAAIVKVHDDVKNIAIISGGADKYIKEAAEAGADCFITGCVDEPVWDDAFDYEVSFLGLGHYGTETIGPQALAESIEKHFEIPAVFIATDNPF